MGQWIFPVLMLLHKIVIFSGLLVAWFGLDGVVKYFMAESGLPGFVHFPYHLCPSLYQL
jgi:hypothetical protein